MSRPNTGQTVYVSGVAVTPADATELPVTAALYVGTGGNLSLMGADGDIYILRAVPTGALLPLAVRRVRSTDTTASNIVALR